MEIVRKFNGLNGCRVSRETLNDMYDTAIENEQFLIADRIKDVLQFDADRFDVELETPAFEQLRSGLMGAFEIDPFNEDNDGLNKAVSANDILDMITKKMLEMIAESTKSYQKKWKDTGYVDGADVGKFLVPLNFVSKKPYRGINYMMLSNMGRPLENPYFLTFKQVSALKGKVKKGAIGKEVIYYTKLFTASDKEKGKSISSYDRQKVEDFSRENEIPEDKISSYAMLKYYNVFNGNDIEGIDFKLDQLKTGLVLKNVEAKEDLKFPVAEAMIANYPKVAPRLQFGGQKASYSPQIDRVLMPIIQDFDTMQDYYRTFFHELAHSTGHTKRLNRDQTGSFGSPKYAKEELVAEFAAVFLSAESGIIWYNDTNHAAYLKNWGRAIDASKNDNKFFISAAAAAQKAFDLILNFDEKGTPAYFADIAKFEKEKADKAKSKKEVPAIEVENDFKVGQFYLEKETKDTIKITEIDDNFVTVDNMKGKLSSINHIRISIFRNLLNDGMLILTKEQKKSSDYGKKRKFEKTAKKLPFSKEDIPYETAYRAHTGTSFSPEKRAVMEQNGYYSHLEEVYNENLATAKKLDKLEEFNSKFERYKSGYLKKYLAYLSSRHGLMSTMITGGSKFPVARMNKKNEVIGKRLNELVDYGKYSNFFKPESNIIKTGSDSALDQLKEKLRKEEEAHQLTLLYNKIVRKKIDNEAKSEQLKANGFSDKVISSGMSENFKPLPAYASSNRNARMAELKRKIKIEEDLKEKAKTPVEEIPEIKFDGGTIENDYSDNRIKIFFDDKPSAEIRAWIKKAGHAFKWSPRNTAWQRQLNTYYKGNREDLYKFLGVTETSSVGVATTEKTRGASVSASKKEDPVKVDIHGQTALFGANKLNAPVLEVPTAAPVPTIGNIKAISDTGKIESSFFKVNGATGEFLQAVERKSVGSVVITLDGMQGAGKTTTLYQFIEDFASAGNKCLFISGEEHPESSLAVEKRDKYLSKEAIKNTSIVAEVESLEQLAQYINPFEIIFIDSWQKLQRMVGNIRLDEDLRKKFNGKVFVCIFQQTTTGRTKGGAEIVFDGDIIIKMIKEASFADNYAYFDKNRYTKIPIENIRYNIATATCYNPNEIQDQEQPEEITLSFTPIIY